MATAPTNCISLMWRPWMRILMENGISFDKTDISKDLTLFLYPDDSDRAGQILRIYQQYFMVSNAARLHTVEAAAKGSTFHDLPDHAVIQINDTHPTMVIPELIRLLTTGYGMELVDAIQVAARTCAITNHYPGGKPWRPGPWTTSRRRFPS
ncbi:MAG: glycogen/starch/alpha-glucan phosphorylase [Enterocloster clostridioformis]